jgi:hypothetical protein
MRDFNAMSRASFESYWTVIVTAASSALDTARIAQIVGRPGDQMGSV